MFNHTADYLYISDIQHINTCIQTVLGLLQVVFTERILLILTSCKLVYTIITCTAKCSISLQCCS